MYLCGLFDANIALSRLPMDTMEQRTKIADAKLNNPILQMVGLLSLASAIFVGCSIVFIGNRKRAIFVSKKPQRYKFCARFPKNKGEILQRHSKKSV